MRGVNLSRKRWAMYAYLRSGVISAHVNVVLFLLQNSLCIVVINSRPCMHAHHFQSQQRVHIPHLPQEELRPPKHSRHTNQFTHRIDQANHTSYYGGKEGSMILVGSSKEPLMNLSKKNTSKYSLKPTTNTPHYKPMPNSMKLCKIPTK